MVWQRSCCPAIIDATALVRSFQQTKEFGTPCHAVMHVLATIPQVTLQSHVSSAARLMPTLTLLGTDDRRRFAFGGEKICLASRCVT